MSWFYLSFADEEFLGGVIIEGEHFLDARLNMIFHGVKSPGGEVLGVELPAEMVPFESYRNRLLTSDEIREFWPDAKTIREHEDLDGNEIH